MNKAMQTQLIKYGGAAGLSAEMSRRRNLRKNPYAHFKDPNNAQAAANKRWSNVKDQAIPS